MPTTPFIIAASKFSWKDLRRELTKDRHPQYPKEGKKAEDEPTQHLEGVVDDQ